MDSFPGVFVCMQEIGGELFRVAGADFIGGMELGLGGGEFYAHQIALGGIANGRVEGGDVALCDGVLKLLQERRSGNGVAYPLPVVDAAGCLGDLTR